MAKAGKLILQRVPHAMPGRYLISTRKRLGRLERPPDDPDGTCRLPGCPHEPANVKERCRPEIRSDKSLKAGDGQSWTCHSLNKALPESRDINPVRLPA